MTFFALLSVTAIGNYPNDTAGFMQRKAIKEPDKWVGYFPALCSKWSCMFTFLTKESPACFAE